MNDITLSAATTFGLEAVVKRELIDLGYNDITVSDGSVEFKANIAAIPKTNINLRCADRIYLVLSKFKAETFEELYQGVKAIEWSDYIPKDGKFIITGKSIKSTLSSVPSCQSVSEKAVIDSMKKKYKIDRFSKSGNEYKIQIALLKDTVTVSLDTTGDSLHKRGYRERQLAAPLKETLAAALIELSFWKKDRLFLDPTCGSGTIAIEAAMIARNIPPGVSRSFSSDKWDFIDKVLWKNEKKEAMSNIDYNFTPDVYASDIDPKAIEIAKHNAYLAGVDDCIRFESKSFKEVTLKGDYGVCICNPPYAERMGELKEVEELYRNMGELFRNNPTWSFYTITSHEGFEKLYGKKADKKRKLFNGNVKVDYYQYYGTRPPKKI
ncbi:MAG: class I SAM-dependent RNA methyltransferase [Firmicutes bacterium]|nr:class I SAM-dependent RNA methyltransferase [Bacillota bacterium]